MIYRRLPASDSEVRLPGTHWTSTRSRAELLRALPKDDHKLPGSGRQMAVGPFPIFPFPTASRRACQDSVYDPLRSIVQTHRNRARLWGSRSAPRNVSPSTGPEGSIGEVGPRHPLPRHSEENSLGVLMKVPAARPGSVG